MIDLFGNPITEKDVEDKPPSSFRKGFGPMNYRTGFSKEKRCKTCKNVVVHEYGKTYYKCRFLGVSGNPRTDIRAGAVCDRWEAKEATQ